MVSPGVLSQLQDELRRAVKGEESARERISAQVTQLEQAQLRWAAVDVDACGDCAGTELLTYESSYSYIPSIYVPYLVIRMYVKVLVEC